MAQNLGQIKALLAAHGLHPKKRFGQNFLHDDAQMRRILAASQLAPGDLVLEVGPGTGALSERLLEAGARLVAVEIDRDLQRILHEVLAGWGEQARLIEGDVLAGKHAINPQVVEALGGQPYKLIANLPYNVASPLLANLVMDRLMQRAVVMIQKEVADRLGAGPGSKDYGPLGVLVQAMCTVERVSVLPPSCFWPQPEVDSAVVALSPRPVPLTNDPVQLSRALQMLFTQRRKQLGRILGRGRAMPAGIDTSSRPEQLTIEQLIELSRWIDQVRADN